MEKLLSALQKDGFNVPDISLDGKLKRFDQSGKNDGWFVGHQLDFCIVAMYGSWKTGKQYEYKSNGGADATERKQINAKLAASAKKATKEKAEDQEKVSAQCSAIFEGANSCETHAYLLAKQVDSFGLKEFTDKGKRVLLVPCRDLNGKIWGFQKVYAGGGKFWVKGQKKLGTFHVIGDINAKEIFICEGYSTGASIHMATGKTVVCAFDSGNLPGVSQLIRSLDSSTVITICGDDDIGVKDNPGRTKASLAAKKCLGRPVFPEFKDGANGTDFNDMHVLYGLSSVKELLAKKKAEKHFVKCMGYRDGTFFYTSSTNKRIVKISSGQHNKHFFRDLMPDAYWRTKYPGDNKELVDWDAVEDELKSKCIEKGFFRADTIRGIGIWRDKCGIVANLGNCIYHDGARIGLTEFAGKSKYTYILDRKMEISDTPLSKKDGQNLVELVHMLEWTDSISAKYFAGWIAVSQACGALKWRPHVWVTGQAGSGKSWSVSDIVHPCIENMALYVKSPESSAPGCRQEITFGAVPIIHDELETEKKGDVTKVNAIIEYWRQSSSDDKASIIKGSAHGESIKYTARFCGMASSVNPTLAGQADQSRVTILEMRQESYSKSERKKRFVEIEKKANQLPENISGMLILKLINHFDWLQKLINMYHDEMSSKFTMRFCDQHATLLAGYRFLITDPDKFDEFDIALDVREISVSLSEMNEEIETDHDDCLETLLNTKLRYYHDAWDRSVEHSILELIVLKNFAVLRRHGIQLNEESFIVANKHPEMSRIFNGTKWASGQWKQSLIRLSGAKKTKPRSWAGKSSRGVEIILPQKEEEE